MITTTSSNHIAGLLRPELIVVELDATSKKRVFEQAGLLFENNQQLARSTVYDALFAREKLGSTGLGLGVAIPHGRIKGLKSATAAFFRLASPIPFDAPDGVGVQLVFVLLVPQSANEQHLQLLSELAQMFSERDFRELLQSAPDSTALLELFSNWQSD
jgi:PTS system nitrogen regulatory IIA component